ncbi:MAG TPA: tol-pal system protein YbgF [Vicinamibacterales bacterium]|nr:tol-pal system protein YbgF [Vicinamibacterales bacterium]
MQKTITVFAVALILSALGAVPAGAQNREHQQMTAELRMLQEQTQQLALSLAQIADAIKALNTRLDASDQGAQKRFADQELLIKNLTSELSTIRERTQDTDTRLRSLSDEISALRSTVTSLPNLLTSGGASSPGVDSSSASTAPSPAGVAATPTSSPSTGSSTLGLSPSRMLESARSDYFSGSYASAITGFEALVKAFPTSEAAAEAYYYLGETYYTQKRNQDAVSAYTRVIQSYPKSNWLPDAYFKRGRALEALGQVDEARASYEQLIKNFAGSAPAGLARQRLDALRRQSSTPAKP